MGTIKAKVCDDKKQWFFVDLTGTEKKGHLS